MLRTKPVGVVCCLIQVIVCTHAIAKDEPATGGYLSTNTYFKANPADGAPIQPQYCGYNYSKKGWLSRDLGQGVNVEVGITYEKGKAISATLLFRYYDGKLILSPDQFEFRAMPNATTYKSSKVRRNNYEPNNPSCAQYGEWVNLEFPIQSELVENVELIIPDGSVTKRGPINVRPFHFQKSTE